MIQPMFFITIDDLNGLLLMNYWMVTPTTVIDMRTTHKNNYSNADDTGESQEIQYVHYIPLRFTYSAVDTAPENQTLSVLADEN